MGEVWRRVTGSCGATSRSRCSHSGDNPASLDDVTVFFPRPDSHMIAAIADSSAWHISASGVDLEPSASAPIMRTQDIIHPVGVISSRYIRPPAAW